MKSLSVSAIFALLLASYFSATFVNGFNTPLSHRVSSLEIGAPRSSSALQSSPKGNNQEDKLKQLGFSDKELQRSNAPSDPEPIKVNVNLLPEIDAVTLTAVGFGLIAANFFIFANLGDGGVGGIIASLINLSRQ